MSDQSKVISELAVRRQRLNDKVEGPILLMGNGLQARNLPMVSLPFRQDSTFLYFSGCHEPDAALLWCGQRWTLYLPTPGAEDALWHGPTPSLERRGAELGFDHVRSSDELQRDVAEVVRESGLSTLAVSDESRNQLASWWSGTPLKFGQQHGSAELVAAVIELRRTKSDAEISALRQAAEHSAAAHVAVAQAARPGSSEASLASLFQSVLSSRGCVTGYDTILTAQGEVLHQRGHEGVLRAGDLLLVDGGGEVKSGYTADITRTWPIGGPLSGRKRAAYDAVLRAQLSAIDLCRVGVRFREVHDAACRVLIEFLISEGLLRCDAEESMTSGAHGVFFPHGIGHHLGLDVHDLENFGDLPSYPEGASRPEPFGTRFLRLDLPLQANWVVTVEPGLYAAPSIIHDEALRARLGDRINWAAAEQWIGLGGIRIEDDVAVTADSPDVLSASTPKSLEALETLVGAGPTVEERFGVSWSA